MRRPFVMIAIFLVIAGCAGGSPAPSTAAGGPSARSSGSEPIIRVLVLSSSGSATVASTGAVKITGGGKNLLSSDRGGTVSIQRTSRGLRATHISSR